MQKKVLVVLFAMLFIFGITTSAYAAYSGTTDPGTLGAPSYTAPLVTGDSADTGLGNANNTGDKIGVGTDDNLGGNVANVIKSLNMTNINGTAAAQLTHGSYQSNTNSCASCHQTHTAQAAGLLFKQGVYATCTACHDGTLGFYNVMGETNMSDGSLPTAGTFGGVDGGNPSVHLSDGTVGHNLAPGGNFNKIGTGNGNWTESFDCASCHAPHGSYSDRLLHYSPNGMGAVPIANGGLQIANIAVATSIPASGSGFVLVVNNASALGLTVTGDPVAARVYDFSKGTWDTTPWLTSTVLKAGATNIDSKSTKVDFVFGKSYVIDVTAGTLAGVTTGTIDRAYVVKLQNATYPKITVANNGTGLPITKINPHVYDETGIGVGIGKYCGACHTDYLAKSGNGLQGMYTVAYRHTTDNDSFTCLKCHFAHGTDVDVMKDAMDNTVVSLTPTIGKPAAIAYMLDKNPSSALKRYTNMAVCWKCHTTSKATQLKNNADYWTGYVNGTVPEGPGNW